MGLHQPTCEDLQKILSFIKLPKDVAEFSANDIAEFFDDLDAYSNINITALVLYYANRNIINYQKTQHLTKELIINPEVLHSLIEITKAKECGEVMDITEEINNQEKSARGRKAVNARHDQRGGSRDKQQKIRDIFATGKYKNNRTICAENEHDAIGMSYSAARKALNNTQDPI
ncbi:MAG: hypothetical protein QM500_11195 [Methylococcales bacterium]